MARDRTRCDAVMLVGFGGPTSPDEVRPFLDGLLRGRPVSRDRYEEAVRHYQAIGGRSPFNEITMRQAEALHSMLKTRGRNVPVAVGMRNWKPRVEDSMRRLAEDGARRVFCFILAAHRSEASWDRYVDTIRKSAQAIGDEAPEVRFPEPWHDHPLFIRALAESARTGIGRLPIRNRSEAQLIFTAHSLPVRMAGSATYVEQLTKTARLVARKLQRSDFTLAFQSRSGDPREPWLEPDLTAVLQNLDGRPAVVVPIGFLCDHLEVLYDLDVAAMEIARRAGSRMERAATVGDDPLFIEMMASVARGHL